MSSGKRTPAHIRFKKVFSVKGLQNLYENKISNSKAVGRDGVTHEIFKSKLANEIEIIIKKVGDCNYKYTIYKQKLISKGPRRYPRTISIATIRDRLGSRLIQIQ
jgi:RNA-directed DNA polymerase